MSDEKFLMWSISMISDRDSVSKQAVSKTIKKLIESRPDTPTDFDGRGRVLAISLAHYDEYRHRYLNPARAVAPIRSGGVTVPPSIGSADSFDEARRVGEWLKVGREKIRHQEQMGLLLRKDMVDDAVLIVGAEIRNIVGRLPNWTDEIARAVSKEGVHGARNLLRKIAFDLGNEIADRMDILAVSAPEHDDAIEEDPL